MSVRLSFGEPLIVAQGPTYQEAGWGTHQFPSIRRLPDGRLAVSYHIVDDTTEAYGLERGWATEDPSGMDWEKPYELMPWLYGKRERWAQSCYYTEMLPLGDNTAMLVYSDFYVPDKDGVKRKSIMVRTIHVD